MKLITVVEYHGCQKEIHGRKDPLRVINQQDKTSTIEILLLDFPEIWVDTLRKQHSRHALGKNLKHAV